MGCMCGWLTGRMGRSAMRVWSGCMCRVTVDMESGENWEESLKALHVSLDCWQGELEGECEGIACVTSLLTGRTGRKVWKYCMCHLTVDSEGSACVTWLLTGRTGRRVWRHCLCHLTVDRRNWVESVKGLHVSCGCWQGEWGELGGECEGRAAGEVSEHQKPGAHLCWQELQRGQCALYSLLKQSLQGLASPPVHKVEEVTSLTLDLGLAWVLSLS